jgi:predicted ATPase/DNA-binding SARP family transcriptional activator
MLWPDMPLKSAQDNLRQTLYQLKKAIPETAVEGNSQPFILSDRVAVRINPDAIYILDVAQFEEVTGSFSELVKLEKAAALYRGDFLADFYLPDSNTFEDWAAEWRNLLRGKALSALEKLTEMHIEMGKLDKAESIARQQIEIDDLRESGYRQLMTALAENGRRNEALRQYETCRERLMDELGVEPAAETTTIFEQIKAGESSGPKQASRARFLLDKPERVRHNLPSQTTSFVGRDREMRAVVRLLQEPDCRLLTLLGPGGIGKTRLSLQAASFLADEQETWFCDGVFQVPLASALSMEELIPTIAEAVGFSFSGSRTPDDQMIAYLKNKEMLLVLDNLEHLAGDSGLLSEFLTAVPGLTLLVTSRARLNLYEEWRFELEGLTVPSETAVEELESYSSVQLFIQRARQAGQVLCEADDLAMVGRICNLLAGLPLGIELAAGWVRTHSLEQIVAEIEQSLSFLSTKIQNVPLRHRSLQVTFDHSWRLLPTDLQQVLAKVSVFRGTFERDAAEYVAGASDLSLAGLVDHSMLHAEGGRFQMNEPLRQFG